MLCVSEWQVQHPLKLQGSMANLCPVHVHNVAATYHLLWPPCSDDLNTRRQMLLHCLKPKEGSGCFTGYRFHCTCALEDSRFVLISLIATLQLQMCYSEGVALQDL